MKISIVTVCYNEEETIKETVESVVNQTYPDVDYVIMDGGSTDKTVEIIRQCENNTSLRLFSEKDNGLYDAMNKSLAHIKGDYVIFMNAGDMFYDSKVLEDVAPTLDVDIVYGDVFRRTKKGDHVQTYKGTHFERIKMMLCGLTFCHQTQFTKVELMRQYGFREDHRITADFDFVVRALGDKRTFKHIDRIICSFDNDGGISANRNNYAQMTREDDTSIRESFPILYYLTIIPKRVFRALFR